MSRTVKKTITVKIFGQEYQLLSDGDDEYIIGLAKKLDTEMRKCSDEVPMLPAGRIAVLTCLNILDKFEQYKSLKKKELYAVLEKVDDIINRLDNKS